MVYFARQDMSGLVNLGQLQVETPRNNLQLASLSSVKIKKSIVWLITNGLYVALSFIMVHIYYKDFSKKVNWKNNLPPY